MKTQWINIDQALSVISNLMISSLASLNWHQLLLAFKFSPNKIVGYLLPLLKQLFRDNFMGSEMEMGILLLFVKSYFLLAVYTIRHNVLANRFKKMRMNRTKTPVLYREDFYQHKQAA